MKLLIHIAIRQLLARKRQSLVSLVGIVLGVAFFLAISSLMRGSEMDFIRRLVDNSPHINVVDEFRSPRVQPIEARYPAALIALRNLKPLTETRGIRGYERILDYLATVPGLRASPVLAGQALVSFAGRDLAVTLNGMIPSEIKGVSTIEKYMVEGTIDDLIGYPDGIVIGSELAKKLSLSRGDNASLAATTGEVRTFKVLGIFRTGRASYDETQVFIDIKRVQALLDRAHRANTIIVKLDDPYQARTVASRLEQRFGYKSVSWQEASEDLISTLWIRNVIMYTVVSAVLIVAGFGIYNVISTVVMEKHRDIAILKSMGFTARDVELIFVAQGVVQGVVGCLLGIPLGSALMILLMQITFKPPGGSEVVSMPISWDAVQFVVAGSFAMASAIVAVVLPARKAGHVHPVDILRGGAW